LKTVTQTIKPSPAAGASFYGSETYSESDEDVTLAILPTKPSKRKCTKSVAPPDLELESTPAPSHEPRKMHRVSAGQGMSKMAKSLDAMAKAMEKKKISIPQPKQEASSPTKGLKLPTDPQEKAIVLLENDALFSDNEMLDVIEFFIAEPNIAKAYASIGTSSLRTNFLERRRAKWESQQDGGLY
jgi:hypothetical protein